MPSIYTDDNWTVTDGTYGGDSDRFPEPIMSRIRKSYEAQGWAWDRENRKEGQPLGPGCGIGKGWLGIIIELDQKLAEIDPDYEIHQIKEKFGGLRYYTKFSFEQGRMWDSELKEHVVTDPEAYARFRSCADLIDEAYNTSEVTCEVCGNEGTIQGPRWLKCRCPEHKPEV